MIKPTSLSFCPTVVCLKGAGCLCMSSGLYRMLFWFTNINCLCVKLRSVSVAVVP